MAGSDFHFYLKQFGLTRNELSEKSGVQSRTLSNYWNDPGKRKTLNCLIIGAVAEERISILEKMKDLGGF